MCTGNFSTVSQKSSAIVNLLYEAVVVTPLVANPPSNPTQAAQLIAAADALVVAAGAGIGVDSGLPDFRGKQGFWQSYPALARANLDFSEIASPQTFQRDPYLAWGFYGHRLLLYI